MNNILKQIGHSLHFIILCYGLFLFFKGILLAYFPINGLLLVILINVFVHYYRVEKPPENVVDTILGKDLKEVDNVVKIIAHRGASLDAPENTLAAFKHCKEKGCNFVELDVALTADEVPVVFHDRSTGRMSNQYDLEISKTNWEDLKKINLSNKHSYREDFPETNILTLEEAVTHLLGEGLNMIIDVKYRDPRLVEIILNLYEKYPELHTRSLISSFYATMIYMIRRKNPKIVAAIAWCPDVIYYANKQYSKNGSFWFDILLHIFDVIHEWLLPRFTYFFTGFSVILLHRYSLDIRTILDWRKKGIRVIAWTINKPTEKKYCHEVLKIPYLTDTLNQFDEEIIELDNQMNYLGY